MKPAETIDDHSSCSNSIESRKSSSSGHVSTAGNDLARRSGLTGDRWFTRSRYIIIVLVASFAAGLGYMAYSLAKGQEDSRMREDVRLSR